MKRIFKVIIEELFEDKVAEVVEVKVDEPVIENEIKEQESAISPQGEQEVISELTKDITSDENLGDSTLTACSQLSEEEVKEDVKEDMNETQQPIEEAIPEETNPVKELLTTVLKSSSITRRLHKHN